MLYSAEAYARDMWPQVNAYYAKTYDGFEMNLHRHKNTEIMYVFSGSCQVYVEPESESPFVSPLKTGDFIFLNTLLKHRLIVGPSVHCTMLNVEFTLAPASGMYTLRNLRAESQDYEWFVSLGRMWYIGNDMHGELFKAMDALVNGLDDDCNAAALRHTEMALVLIQLSRVTRAGIQKPNASLYVRRAAGFIQQNYTRDIRVSDAAQYAGISAGYMSRIFSASVGRTVAEYIEHVRLNHAVVLLEKSGLRISDICIQVGFGNRQRFNAAFRREYGLSPVEYRVKSRANGRVNDIFSYRSSG